MKARPAGWFLFVVAAFFFAAALYHVVLAAAPGATGRTRHAVFAVLDALVAAGLVRRPRVMVPLFAILVIQQLYSHGTLAVRRYEQGQFDYTSIVIVILLPVTLVVLARQTRAERVARGKPT